VNFWFGDYIEACYPYLERDPWVDAAAHAGSALAGAMLAADGWATGTAYAPALLVPLLSTRPRTMAAASLAAAAVPFVVCLARNRLLGPAAIAAVQGGRTGTGTGDKGKDE
jgi:hypothetical protein